MHLLLRITNKLNIMRKLNENASRNNLRKLTRNNKLLLNRVKKELKKDNKIMLRNKINKIKKIMQTDNALSN